MAVGNHRRKQSVIVREESRVQNRVLHAPPLYVAMIGMLGYHRGVIRSSSNLIALASTTLAFLRQMCPLRRPAVNSEFSATPTLQEHNYAFLMPPPRVERSSALQRLLVAFAVEGSYRQLHLHDLVGDLPWRYSASTRTLHFGVELAFPATLVGSDNRAGDFRWAWANAGLPGCRSRAVRDAGLALGVIELSTPHVRSDGSSCTRALAMAAAAALDSPAFFCDFQRGFVLLLDRRGDQDVLPRTGEEGAVGETERIIESVWEAAAVLGDAIVEGIAAFVDRRGGVLERRGDGRLLCWVPGANVIEARIDEEGRGLMEVNEANLDAL